MQTHTPTPDPTAVIGRRILAWLIDFLIIAAIWVAIAMATFTNTSLGNADRAQEVCEAINEFSSDVCVPVNATVFVGESDIVGLMLIIGFAYALFATILIPGFTGWSPGKLVMKLRVVNKDTFELAGMGPNIGRGLLWAVDSFPWFVPFVGFITGLVSKGHRRVGDMATNTLVVDKSLVGHPVAVPGVNEQPELTGAQAPQSLAGFPPTPPAGPFAAPPTGSQPHPGIQPPAPTQPPPTTPAPAPPTASGFPPPFPPMPSSPPESEIVAPDPDPEPAAPVPAIDEPTVALEAVSTGPDDPTVTMDELPPEASTEAEPIPEPAAEPAPEPEPVTEPAPAPAPAPPPAQPRPGIDSPQWDNARNTYIQWDPQLSEWMEWNEAEGRWIPISQ